MMVLTKPQALVCIGELNVALALEDNLVSNYIHIGRARNNHVSKIYNY